jgi:hypothetical protein
MEQLRLIGALPSAGLRIHETRNLKFNLRGIIKRNQPILMDRLIAFGNCFLVRTGNTACLVLKRIIGVVSRLNDTVRETSDGDIHGA